MWSERARVYVQGQKITTNEHINTDENLDQAVSFGFLSPCPLPLLRGLYVKFRLGFSLCSLRLCGSPHTSSANCKIASDASTAVSVRSTSFPSEASVKPDTRARTSSSSVQPPSGPIETAAECAFTCCSTS